MEPHTPDVIMTKYYDELNSQLAARVRTSLVLKEITGFVIKRPPYDYTTVYIDINVTNRLEMFKSHLTGRYFIMQPIEHTGLLCCNVNTVFIEDTSFFHNVLFNTLSIRVTDVVTSISEALRVVVVADAKRFVPQATVIFVKGGVVVRHVSDKIDRFYTLPKDAVHKKYIDYP